MLVRLDRRQLLAASAAGVAASLLGSCGRRGGGSIRFVVRTGLESGGLRAIATEFTRRTGTTVEVNELGRDGYLSAVPTQLLAGGSNIDVAFVASTLVPELASGGAIAALDDKMNVADPDLIAKYGFRDRTYAIPTDISSMFLFYRRDLIATPPTTWAEYATIARRFTRSITPSSPTQFGAAFPGQAGEELPKGFYNALWSYGGDILNANGGVAIGDPAAIEAARYYRSLVTTRVVSPDITSWGFTQMFEGLLNGSLAMAAPFWNAAAPLIAASDSEFKDRIAYALVPGVAQAGAEPRRVPFQHSWTLVLNARSRNGEAAARFIEFATGAEGGRMYAETAGGNPARYSILEDASLHATRPDFPVLASSLRLAKAEPAVPYYAQMHTVMNESLTRLLTGAQTPEQAMAGAAAGLRALTASPSR